MARSTTHSTTSGKASKFQRPQVKRRKRNLCCEMPVTNYYENLKWRTAAGWLCLTISVYVTYLNYWIFRLLQHVSLLNKRRRQVIHALTHDNGMDASRGPSNWWFKFMYILQIHSTMHGYIYIYITLLESIFRLFGWLASFFSVGSVFFS